MLIILKSILNTDTSIFVFSREKLHDSKYSKYAEVWDSFASLTRQANFIFWLDSLIFSAHQSIHIHITYTYDDHNMVVVEIDKIVFC
jgi:hypothetical protein